MSEKKTVLFAHGQIVATPNVLEQVSIPDLNEGLYAHLHGDWGAVSEEDKEINDQAVLEGGRIHSAYLSSRNVRYWIITEADRSVTTLLMPEDY